MGASSKTTPGRRVGKGRKVGGGKRRPPPLTLSVRGFKSLRDPVEVQLRPLTLLSGRNSSGKSSLMQPLLLLKQTLEAPLDYGPLRLDGPNVHFSEARQLFWQGKSKADKTMELVIGVGRGSRCEFVFSRGTRGLGLDRVEVRYEDGHRTTFQEDSDPEEVLRDFTVPRDIADARFKRSKFCLEVVIALDSDDFDVPAGSVEMEIQAFATQVVERLFHVPGLRGNPERFYPITAVGDRFPGPFPPYTASVLARWMSQRDERLDIVAEQLRELGLTWKVEARRLDDTRLELRVARTYAPQRGGAKDLVNVADVGFGVSQVLPVVVALLAAKKGDIVHIEQPEIHLHPAAQARLAQPLAAAAKRGVIVVAETHSPLLLRAVQQLVADGTMPARDVALHWFRRDDDGATQITTAELHADGTYGDWPEDFASTEMDEELQLLAAMAGTDQ